MNWRPSGIQNFRCLRSSINLVFFTISVVRNGELEFGEGSMLLPTLKQIVETKFIPCKQNLPTMCCLWTFHSPKKLQWLKDLLCFDAFALDDKESIHDTLNIVQEGCRWRLDALYRDVVISIEAAGIHHDRLGSQLIQCNFLLVQGSRTSEYGELHMCLCLDKL